MRKGFLGNLYRKYIPIYFSRCLSPVSEEKVYKQLTLEEDIGANVPRDRHKNCLNHLNVYRPTSNVKFDLSILRTCRQIRREAALLPFSSNHFLVESGDVGDFLGRLTDEQVGAIRTLQINCVINFWGGPRKWTLTPDLAPLLSGIRRFYITLDLTFVYNTHLFDLFDTEQGKMEDFLNRLMDFTRLPLCEVFVMVESRADRDIPDVKQRAKWARQVRDILLEDASAAKESKRDEGKQRFNMKSSKVASLYE